MESFTVTEAIEIQSKQLNQWKQVLKPSFYSVLVEYAQSNNEYSKISNNPNQVIRGSQLSCFINNTASKFFAAKKLKTK